VNNGDVPVTLDSVLIADNPLMPGTSTQFTFSGSLSLLPLDQSIPPHDTVRFTVYFAPTGTSSALANIVYVWDTSQTGATFTTVNTLSGEGYQLGTVISARKEYGASLTDSIYSKHATDTFNVPIALKQTLPVEAQAYGYVFDLTYRNDLFDVISITLPPGASFPSGWPMYDSNSTGDKTIHFKVTSPQPITTQSELASIRYEVVVSKDSVSDFVLANGAFLDKSGNQLCYIATEHIPGTFISQDLCGNVALRQYLQSGVQAVSIANPIPNPFNSTTTLNYNVFAAGTPITIELYNMLGEKVQTIMKDRVHAIGGYAQQLSAEGLSSGTYMIKVSSPTSIKTQSIVLSR